MTMTTSRITCWLNRHPKISQWVWLIILWCGGLLAALVMAYPIKLLIRSMS